MHLLFNAIFLIAAIIWGDWRNWRKYYSTILFIWFGDLLYNFLCYDYKMWEYKESIFGLAVMPNHTIITLLIMFISYPSSILIFLGRFPEKKLNMGLWIIFWVSLFSLIEYINLHFLNLITHHNGWTIGWSVFFNAIIFVMLRLHYKYPTVALITSIPIIFFFVIYFHVPIR
ncbi:CBO0543 family protein [Neobacillus niacini]|uniref:CBO0543 family protein n=1 Tax=Neobacillus niacini TaxID=86668 RepID=UPI0028BEE119|nr:CBO0543 family protein [Neobacillus niacini]